MTDDDLFCYRAAAECGRDIPGAHYLEVVRLLDAARSERDAARERVERLEEALAKLVEVADAAADAANTGIMDDEISAARAALTPETP